MGPNFFYTFVEKTSQPSLFCLLVTPKTPAGQTFLELEKQAIITWCEFGTVWKMLGNFPLELFERQLRSSSCTLVLRYFNSRHHFLTSPSFIAPSAYTSKFFIDAVFFFCDDVTKVCGSCRKFVDLVVQCRSSC